MMWGYMYIIAQAGGFVKMKDVLECLAGLWYNSIMEN